MSIRTELPPWAISRSCSGEFIGNQSLSKVKSSRPTSC